MRQMEQTAATLGAGLGVLRLVRASDAKPVYGVDEQDIVRASTLADGESVRTMRQTVTTIGRGLHNAVVLLDPSVSRDHARIVRDDDDWRVENLSTHNPVWVGKRELGPGEQALLASGDLLTLGNTTLQFLAPKLASDSAAAGDRQASMTNLNLLDPGVTLQFALADQFPKRARWVLVLLGAFLFIASALVTLGTAALVGRNALAMHGVGAVLAALTIPLVPALGAALLVGAIDRYEREPVVVLIGAFAWGALIAIPAALYIERVLDGWLQMPGGTHAVMSAGAVLTHSALQGLSAGLTEETVKGAGLLVLLLALRDEFDNVTDGILYGILIGAGFAMVENFVYFAGSPRGDLGFLILGRVVLGWLGHSTFTALFGAGLGYARETRDRRRKVVAPLLGFAVAVLLHTVFDFVDFQANASVHTGHPTQLMMALALVAVMADYLPLFAAQAMLLRMLMSALRREADVVREYLATEVSGGVVTPDEYAVLQNASLRARVEHHYLLMWGPRAYLTARALHQTITGLAFRKWHVVMGDQPKVAPRQPEEIYRERIARLRRALAREVQRRTPTVAAEVPLSG